MKKAILILNKESCEKIYGPEELKRAKKYVEILGHAVSGDQIIHNEKLLKECNIILSGWGGPCIDKQFIDNAPNLEAVFYGAGSIKGIVTPYFWKSGIPITSAWAANAVPVAEYTFAQIILCLKNTYRLNRLYTEEFPVSASKSSEKKSNFSEMYSKREAFGTYRTIVGIISLGMIGRLVCKFLKTLDVDVIVYDPFINKREAAELGVKLVELEEIFLKSHVVTLHTPWLPETENMIVGKYFKMMRMGASFINTARGAIVNEKEMTSVLIERNDLTAVLDVTYPEPPELGSPLYKMKNVFLTPHIAGSMNDECRRMGKFAIDEMIRFIEGEPLMYQITEEKFKTLA